MKQCRAIVISHRMVKLDVSKSILIPTIFEDATEAAEMVAIANRTDLLNVASDWGTRSLPRMRIKGPTVVVVLGNGPYPSSEDFLWGRSKKRASSLLRM